MRGRGVESEGGTPLDQNPEVVRTHGMDIKGALARAIASMTQQQAMDAYHALAQWAENTDVGIQETVDPGQESEPEFARAFAQLAAVSLVVEACEAELAAGI